MSNYGYFVIWLLLLCPDALVAQESEHRLVDYIKEVVRQNESALDFEKARHYYFQKKPDSTLYFAYRAISLSEKREILDLCYFFRGASFKEKKLFAKAFSELQKVSSGFLYHDLKVVYEGEIYLEQQDFEKALSKFLAVEQKHGPDVSKNSLLHNIGLCYFHTRRFDEAENYLMESTRLQEQKADTSKLIGAYMDLANLYYEQYKDDLAIPYFEKAYRLSKLTKNNELRQNAALNMAVVEENRKNLAQSLIYRKEYEMWRDSLYDQNQVWTIAELEKKYAIARKEKEIELLESENRVKITQRNSFIISSMLLLLLLATGAVLYSQKIKSNKIILNQKQALDQLNITKDKLFSVVSHDLRSSVNGLKINSEKLLKDIKRQNYNVLAATAQKNADISSSTYNLLDNLLHWANLQTRQVYFQRESLDLLSVVTQVASDYEALFYNKRITFENKVAKGVLVFADLNSIKVILRNLFDNAIKFSEEDSLVSIYVDETVSDTYLHFVVEDSGIGMNEELQQALLTDDQVLVRKKNQRGVGTGLGIQLCKSMAFQNKGKLLIESQEGSGTKMIVALLKKSIP